MGYDLRERAEEQQRIATQIAVAAKALQVCEFHGIAFEGGEIGSAERLSLACQIANAKWSASEIEDGLFENRRELTDAIKSAISDHPADECPLCEKHRLED